MDLPKHPVVHGHPIHAILSDGPAVMIPVALLMEGWRLTRKGGVAREVSDLAARAATATAAAAGLIGWIDWLTMPGEHPAKKPATLHGLVNSGALVALVGASLDRRRRLPWLSAATASVLVGGWIGGDLVFSLGWRVRPVEEAEIAEQRLAEAGQQAFAAARREVDDFERRKTFLPPA